MERHALSYGFSSTIDGTPAEVLQLARDALAAEGFGVLCEIDVAATLRQKIGLETGPYVILGVCNPSLAGAALSLDRDVGLLLPCNVVVYGTADPKRSVLSVIDPERAMTLSECEALHPIAAEASARLRRALRAVEGTRQTAAPPLSVRPRLISSADADAIEEIC